VTNPKYDSRDWLRQKINAYLRQGLSPARRTQAEDTLSFVNQHMNCFSRGNQVGHITGSSLIINEGATHTLLHHHRKIDKWIQLGGHSDDDSNTLRVALTEAEEESGLTGFRVVSEDIFDIDVHEFPAMANLKAHLHYDVRFLLQISSDLPLNKIDRESKDIAWIPLERIMQDDDFVLVRKLVRCLDGHQVSNI
jgi:8-oxo-dGTP pyrophosphatase MutT (NUDIX family)